MNEQPPKFETSSTNDTVEAIKGHGDIRTKVAIIWVVGGVIGILAIGGLIIFFKEPETSKDLWVIIGPIITAGITGGIAYLMGEKSKNR